MDNFTKDIELKFDIDEQSQQQINDFIESISEVEVHLNLDEDLKKEVDVVTQGKDGEEKKEDTSFGKPFTDALGNEFRDIKAFATDWKVALATSLASILSNFVDEIKDTFTSAWSELDTILSYSQLTDSTVRDQAFTYGFTPAQNYAFSKTKSLMGLSSEEDLWYMDDRQREQFYERFNYYADKYEQLYDSGWFDDLQEFQWEMAEFKEDIMYEALDFIVENKDTIKVVFEAILVIAEIQLDIFEGLMAFVQTFVDMFEGYYEIGTHVGAAIGAQVAGVTNNSSNTTNISVDNNFSNVSQADQSWLTNAVGLSYEQLLEVLRVN